MANKIEQQRYAEVVGKQSSPAWIILATIGLLLIVAGTVMPIFSDGSIFYGTMPEYYKYVYTAGAAMLLVARLFSPYRGNVDRIKRLSRIEVWGALFFCVGAFFLYYEPNSSRDWLAFTLAGAAIQIYTSLMIPRAINKALKSQK